MRSFRSARRAILLALSLLSACAAADPTASSPRTPPTVGSSGNFLSGRFALNHGDFDTAAVDLLQALSASPGDQELLLQTFIACINAGRPEAIPLARRLPTSQAAELLLANAAAKSGDWDQTLMRLRAVSRDGVMQLLQPLLQAWASQGKGDTDQALATLRPYLDNPRYRAVVALHAGMIADLSGRQSDAAGYFQQAEPERGDQDPRTAVILASWYARSGQLAAAEGILVRMAANVPEAEIALPGMMANISQRPVARALDGMAEAYTTFAAALRTRETGDLAMVMSRLALDVKPDSANARLMAADIQATAKHDDAALALLDGAARGNKDPIVPVIRLRRAAILERLERTDEAIREVERIGRDYPNSSLPDIELGDLLRSQAPIHRGDRRL